MLSSWPRVLLARTWCPESEFFEVSLEETPWLCSDSVPHGAGHTGGRCHQTVTAKYTQHPQELLPGIGGGNFILSFFLVGFFFKPQNGPACL